VDVGVSVSVGGFPRGRSRVRPPAFHLGDEVVRHLRSEAVTGGDGGHRSQRISARPRPEGSVGRHAGRRVAGVEELRGEVRGERRGRVGDAIVVLGALQWGREGWGMRDEGRVGETADCSRGGRKSARKGGKK
jgi:hypothetical protein